jgi:hypothetical protein
MGRWVIGNDDGRWDNAVSGGGRSMAGHGMTGWGQSEGRTRRQGDSTVSAGRTRCRGGPEAQTRSVTAVNTPHTDAHSVGPSVARDQYMHCRAQLLAQMACLRWVRLTLRRGMLGTTCVPGPLCDVICREWSTYLQYQYSVVFHQTDLFFSLEKMPATHEPPVSNFTILRNGLAAAAQ